jgi:bifunctional UDP-N-acetylglucosamine pyrophosphorylase/glucosamine-1-phosphate N-acetyltransferase
VCRETILDHIVEALPSVITEIILVTNYLEEQIHAHCGEEFRGRKVLYVTQENPAGGTGAALLATKHLITGKFMVMNGDDIHGSEALARAVAEPNALITVHSDTPELFGVVETNGDGTLKRIVEKPEHPQSNLVNTGGFVAEVSLLDCEPPVSASGEVYATDMLTLHAGSHPVRIIEQEEWIPIGNPEQLAAAEARLCPQG